MPMRTKEECLAILGKYGLGDAQYQAAKAELETLIAQEYLGIAQEHLRILQKTRENLYEVLAAMNSEVLRFREAVDAAGIRMSREVGRFREVVDRAATDASATSNALARWTKVLAFATIALVLATGALVYAAFATAR